MSETDGASPEPDAASASDDEIRDALPEDLNAVGYVGVYQFPDNSRRRIPGVLYLVSAAICVAIWASKSDSAVLINDGFLWVGVLLAAVGVFSITSGWRMQLDETDALVAATKSVAFPVGHASAQLAWRGLRSRPTWRILCYSIEEPPLRRGFVLIDAIDGEIVSSLVEDNPEDWSKRTAEPAA
ncbi:MAG: hypothetical protein AB7V43_01420 [Acidimicrobiia bacterium]